MKAFTLIELVIVFAITAIISSIGMSSFTSFNRSQLFGTGVSEVTSLLATARSSALSQVIPSVCSSSVLNGYNVIPTISGQDYELDVVCDGTNQRIGNAKKLPGQLTFQSGSAASIFFDVATGIVNSPGSIILTGYGRSQAININKTGIVSVSDTIPVLPAPTPTVAPAPTSSPTATQAPVVTATPIPTNTPIPTPTATPTPTPTPPASGTLTNPCSPTSATSINVSYSFNNGTNVSLFRGSTLLTTFGGATGASTYADSGLSGSTSYTYYLRNGNTTGAAQLGTSATCSTPTAIPPASIPPTPPYGSMYMVVNGTYAAATDSYGKGANSITVHVGDPVNIGWNSNGDSMCATYTVPRIYSVQYANWNDGMVYLTLSGTDNRPSDTTSTGSRTYMIFCGVLLVRGEFKSIIVNTIP